MDTIVQNTWGLKEAKDAGLAMPEMRFPELENAVAAEAREDVDRVLSAGYDALVRGWNGDEGDEVRKQRREAAVEAFGDEWVELYEQTDEGGRARVAGKRFLRDFCKVDGGDEYDALLAYKEAKKAGDVKDFGTMWRHFAAGRGKELADFEAKEKARREEGLPLMLRVVRGGVGYEERAWVSDEEVEKWNADLEKGEEEKPKGDDGRVRGPWESYTDLAGMLGPEESVRERAKVSGQMNADGTLRRRAEVEAELAGRAAEARNAAMDEFYAGKARGLFTDEEERSVRRAQAAFKLFDELTDDFTTAAFDVYAQPEAGRGIYGMLEGDEMAKALFFSAVKEKVGEMLGTERMRTRAERFARAFKAADVKLMGMPLVDGEFDEGNEAASRFRAQMYQAVNGVYDTDGSVAAALGAMMPTSVSFLVPYAGPAVVFRQAQKDAYVNDLAEGVGFDAAMVRSVGSGAIETVVEGIAFGKMGKAFTPKWVDKVMQTPAMGRVLGKVYGSTAGRFGMSFGTNMAEEVIGEPLAAAGLGYVWNALAPEAYELDDPWEGLKSEVGEMLKPENLGATALYGLLLGAVSAPGQAGEAKAYRDTLEALKLAGVDEGRAGQIARMEDGVERMATASREGAMALSMAGDEKVAEVAKVLAEKYPGFGELVTFTRYYAEGKMPKLTEAGVDEEGRKVYEVEMAGKGSVRMSEGQARAFVESKLEDMVEEEQARLADAFLADRMVDALARDKERWVTEEVQDRGG